MKFASLVGVLVLLLGVIALAHRPPPARAAPVPGPQDIELVAEPIPLNPRDSAQTRVGALSYVWGARLRARGTSRFGGVSGLEVEENGDGLTFTAVTDDGDTVRFPAGADGAPAGPAVLRPLLDQRGRIPDAKAERDAEDIAFSPGGFLVSFEGRHRIRRYAGGRRAFHSPAEAVPAPVVSALHDNLGFEALAWLPGPGGGVLAVGAEDGRLWLCPEGAGRCTLALGGPPEFGWWLTGLTRLPGTGDLLGLYRFYNPFTKDFRASVAWLQVRDGGVRVVPLAQLARPLTVANFEGIAAVRRGAGHRIFLVSDDGFAADGRTLLMAFDWSAQAKGPASPPAPVRGR